MELRAPCPAEVPCEAAFLLSALTDELGLPPLCEFLAALMTPKSTSLKILREPCSSRAQRMEGLIYFEPPKISYLVALVSAAAGCE